MQNGGSQLNWTVVSSISFSISKSHQGVNSVISTFDVPVWDWEECSNNIDIDEDTIILNGSGDVVLINQVSLVQIVPVKVTVVFVDNGTFFLHVIYDIKIRISIISSSSISRIKSVSVSSDGDSSIFVNNNHVFIRTKSKSHDEGIDVDRVIISSASFLISISKTDKGVDLKLLVWFFPCRDHEECSYNVSVDGEEEDSVGRVNWGFVKGVGISQVVPIFSLEEFVNLRGNLK